MCAGLPIEVAQRKMLSQCRAGLPIEIVQRKLLSQCQAGLPIDILLMKKSRIKCRTEASFIVPEFTTSLYGSSCRKKFLFIVTIKSRQVGCLKKWRKKSESDHYMNCSTLKVENPWQFASGLRKEIAQRKLNFSSILCCQQGTGIYYLPNMLESKQLNMISSNFFCRQSSLILCTLTYYFVNALTENLSQNMTVFRCLRFGKCTLNLFYT